MTTSRTAIWVILVLLSIGCSSRPNSGMGATAGGSARSGSPAIPTAIPSARAIIPDPAADRDAAADGYRRFWAVAYTLDAHPVAEWSTRLGAVATNPLLPKLLNALTAQHASGIREYGRVLPRLVTVETHGDIATIFDCQDASGAGEAYADTGLPKTVGDARTPIAASMRRGPDGHWRVSTAKQVDSSC